MYNGGKIMNWDVILMDSTITAALIGAFVSTLGIIATLFNIRGAIKYSGNNLTKEHDGLSKEHNGLSKEHDNLKENLSRGQIELKERILEGNKGVSKINETMLKEEHRRKSLYRYLEQDKTNNPAKVVDTLGESVNLMYKLIETNNELHLENANLKQENSMMQSKLNKYEPKREKSNSKTLSDEWDMEL